MRGKPIAVLMMLTCLYACRQEEMIEDQFLIDASAVDSDNLAKNLSSLLRTSMEPTRSVNPNANPSTLYRLDGREFSLIMAPLADDRCNPNASYRSTFGERKFRADLIYLTASPEEQRRINAEVVAALRRAGTRPEPFHDC